MISKFINILITNNIISSEERSIYEYGLSQIPHMMINIIFSIFIGYIFNLLPEVIFFQIIYIGIRSYSGGYHAKTRIRCTILSSLIIIFACILITVLIELNYKYKFSILYILGIFSSAFIYCLSPIQSANNPLTKCECVYIRKKLLKRLIVSNFFLTFFSLFHFEISLVIAISYIFILFLMIPSFFNL